MAVDVAVQEADLAVVGLDEVSEHGDPVEVGGGELERVELGAAARSPHVVPTRQDPVLGHDRVDLGLQTGAQVGQLESEADHLAELRIRRCDRRLGQAIEAQQVGEIPRVAVVVLHPAMSPVVAVRVGEVDGIAHLVQEVDRPVPAIGRLDDDVAADWGGTDLFGKAARFVVDPDRVDLLSGLVHPIDDRPSAVQIDAHILLCHRGLPCRGVSCDNQSRQTGSRHGEREDTLLHAITMGAGANPKDHYSAQVESAEEWTVERQLADKPKAVVDLYRRFVRLMTACGPYTVSVTKTAIAFEGIHRGFAGAKPRKASLDGFLDLQREVQDERFLRVSPYTKSLYVHQFRIISAAQLDDSFAALVEEAYQVGCGAHRPPRKTADP